MKKIINEIPLLQQLIQYKKIEIISEIDKNELMKELKIIQQKN